MTDLSEKLALHMTDEFLKWPLPDSVCSDIIVTKQNAPHRVGTNLLTHAEALELFRHILAISELQEALRDAERYRKVRRDPSMLLHLKNSEFDAAVDAAKEGGKHRE